MIGSLRGTLLDRADGEVVVEVGGLGYAVVVAPTTAVSLGTVGDEVFLWAHHHVREDAEVLYGFATRDEKATFAALLGAHGVGPALALAILSVHSPAALARVVADEDVAALCLVPGVGRKTAARLLIELRSRLDGLALSFGPSAGAVVGNGAAGNGGAGNGTGEGDGAGGGPGTTAAGGQGPAGADPRTVHADVRDALVELGYTAEEVRSATARLPAEGDAPTLLRHALARLASGGG